MTIRLAHSSAVAAIATTSTYLPCDACAMKCLTVLGSWRSAIEILALARRVADEFPDAAAFEDLETMLDQGVCDAVIAVTPVSITATIAQTIMAAGVPLLMEKPLGIDIREAEAVCAAANASTSGVMVGMNRRFDRLWQEAGELIRDLSHNKAPAYIITPCAVNHEPRTGLLPTSVFMPLIGCSRFLGLWWSNRARRWLTYRARH